MRIRMTCTALVLCFLAFSCQNKQAEIRKRIPAETYDKLMQMDEHSFDQSGEGWRQYSSDHELLSVLIDDFIKHHGLDYDRARNLNFHKGQVLAFNNLYEEAVESMSKSIMVKESPSKNAWNFYVRGSIAFLESNKEKLDLFTDSLMYADNNMNSEVLIRLQSNFGKPYALAYSGR